MTAPLALTDDEVVALSARAGVVWPSVVPTVDQTDPEALRNGVDRGARALLVRGLLATDDRLDPTLEALIQPVLAGQFVCATYLADTRRLLDPVGLASVHFQGLDAWTSELISVSGVRQLRPNTQSGILETVQDLLASVDRIATSAPAGDGEPEVDYVLCLVRRVEEATSMVTAGKGGLTLYDEVDPKAEPAAGRSVASTEEAFAQIFADLVT